MKNVPALILGVLVLALAGCQPRGGNIPEAALGAWEKAFNADDAAGVAAVYAENATVMPPNAPAIKGRAAIENFMSDGFAQAPGAKISIASDEMFTSGGTGIRRGTYRVTGSDGTELEKREVRRDLEEDRQQVGAVHRYLEHRCATRTARSSCCDDAGNCACRSCAAGRLIVATPLHGVCGHAPCGRGRGASCTNASTAPAGLAAPARRCPVPRGSRRRP